MGYLKILPHHYIDQLSVTLDSGREVKGYYYGGRLSAEMLPKGWHKYDLREDDDLGGDIAEIKDFVLVNHFGTFITRETIDCTDGVAITYWDWYYDADDANMVWR